MAQRTRSACTDKGPAEPLYWSVTLMTPLGLLGNASKTGNPPEWTKEWDALLLAPCWPPLSDFVLMQNTQTLWQPRGQCLWHPSEWVLVHYLDGALLPTQRPLPLLRHLRHHPGHWMTLIPCRMPRSCGIQGRSSPGTQERGCWCTTWMGQYFPTNTNSHPSIICDIILANG